MLLHIPLKTDDQRDHFIKIALQTLHQNLQPKFVPFYHRFLCHIEHVLLEPQFSDAVREIFQKIDQSVAMAPMKLFFCRNIASQLTETGDSSATTSVTSQESDPADENNQSATTTAGSQSSHSANTAESGTSSDDVDTDEDCYEICIEKVFPAFSDPAQSLTVILTGLD